MTELELQGTRTWDSPEHYWQFITDINPMIAAATKSAGESVRRKVRGEVLEALAPLKRIRVDISFNWTAWVDCGAK